MTKDVGSQYSLQNVANFNLELTTCLEDVQIKYNNLLSEYLFFILDNIVIKNDTFFKFIIQRGIITITNVFNLVLHYSKNLDVAYFHSQRAFYFYVEFIGQISEDQHTFLQLSSRDATMFVYKKTIFDINSEIKKKDREYNKDEKCKLMYLEKNQAIYQNLIDVVFENFDLQSLGRQFQMRQHLNKIEKIIQKVLYYKFSHDQLDIILMFIEKNNQYSAKLVDDMLYITIELFLKKYNSCIESDKKEIKNKILQWNLEGDEINISDLDKLICNLFL